MQKLNNKMITPKDCKNWFRILHRSLRSRKHDASIALTHGPGCRLNCGCGDDTLSHLAECPVILQLFAVLEDNPSPQLIYLGIRRDGTPLEPLDEVTFILLWRELYYRYSQLGINDEMLDDYRGFIEKIYRGTFRRIAVLLEAHTRKAQVECAQALAKGNHDLEPICSRLSRCLAPEAAFDHTGRLMISEAFETLLSTFAGYERKHKRLHKSTSIHTMTPPTSYCQECAN